MSVILARFGREQYEAVGSMKKIQKKRLVQLSNFR